MLSRKNITFSFAGVGTVVFVIDVWWWSRVDNNALKNNVIGLIISLMDSSKRNDDAFVKSRD